MGSVAGVDEEALALAAEIAEDWITTVSVFATSAEARAATLTKMEIAGAIRSAMEPEVDATKIA